MKRLLIFMLALAVAIPAIAASPREGKPQSAAKGGAEAAASSALEGVLSRMDQTAGSFKNAQAKLDQTQYTKVVNESDTQKGTIYFQRKGNKSSVEMMIDFAQPQTKQVLYSGNTIQVYQPSIEQVNIYDLSKHKSEVNTFLILGFGGRGHDLPNQFNVTFDGVEAIPGGGRAAKLELVPKSEQVRNNISKILLWIDEETGVSVQQQFFEPSGNYRLAKYSDIKLNQGLPTDAFTLKKTGKTKEVRQ